MKVIVNDTYGGPEVLQLKEVNKPVPKDHEILIRIHAASVNFGDIIARNFRNVSAREFNMPFVFWLFARLAFGLVKPRIKVLGNSFSGEIESVGKKVAGFGRGEPIFGYTGEKMGAYAEFLCLSANSIIAPKPAALSFPQAAALPYGTLVAINLLRRVKIKPGQKVLVVGASGSIGSAAVQLLKNHFGASVSGICSGKKIAYVKNLGVDTVFNYEKYNCAQVGEKYDLIFDILGKGSFSSYKSILNKNGTCIYASFKTQKLLLMILTRFMGSKKVVCALANSGANDLFLIKQLVEEGKIKSFVDKCFPLELVADAHEYVERKKNVGDVIITT
jgi:NADPH:quinone reductase-like Zn-dependent oxidoreductase